MAAAKEWMSIGPGALDTLSDRPGVFLIGSLVRNVLFVGSASEGIRSAVRAALDRPDLRQRARCLKVEPSEDPALLLAEILATYRETHGGALPPAQPTPFPEQRRSETADGTARIGGSPRPGPGRYAAIAATALRRARTVA
jgi:hypothetical protein